MNYFSSIFYLHIDVNLQAVSPPVWVGNTINSSGYLENFPIGMYILFIRYIVKTAALVFLGEKKINLNIVIWIKVWFNIFIIQ